jgi:hypothetical protein
LAEAIPKAETGTRGLGVTVRLKALCEFIVCEHKTAATRETGYPSIPTPNIGHTYFILENVNRVETDSPLHKAR